MNRLRIDNSPSGCLRDSFGILQTTGSLLRGTLLKTIQNLQLSDFPTYSLHIHNIYPTYTLHIASLYLDTILYLQKDKLVLFFYNLDYPTYTLRISSLCLPSVFLGRTLDVPWTYLGRTLDVRTISDEIVRNDS